MPYKMPPQVFILRDDQEVDVQQLLRTCPVVGNAPGINKPYCPGGGLLWTSSLDEADLSSDWLRWCQSEMPEWIGKKAAILKVKSAAKILHIGNQRDYETAHQMFPLVEEKHAGFLDAGQKLDFKALAHQYDAIHVYGAGLSVDALYGWDVESSAWFKPTVLELDRVVDIEQHCSYPADAVVEEMGQWERRQYEEHKLKLSYIRYRGAMYRKVTK
jgi:hypothetical protein